MFNDVENEDWNDLNNKVLTQVHEVEFHHDIRKHIQRIFCESFYDDSPQYHSEIKAI